MLNEILEAKEYHIDTMKEQLESGKEPRLMYKSFIKNNNGIQHVLTVLAREKLFKNNKTKSKITDSDILNAEDCLSTWLEDVYGDDFTAAYLNYLCADEADLGKKKNYEEAIQDFKDSYPDYIKRDAFICFDREYTYKTIIAEALAQGKLKKYKVYIPKSSILRLANMKQDKDEEKTQKRKDLAVKFVYMVAYYAVEVFKRAECNEKKYKKKFGEYRIPFSFYEFQNWSGIGAFESFKFDEYFFETYSEEDIKKGKPSQFDFGFKEKIDKNAIRFFVLKNLFVFNSEPKLPVVKCGNKRLAKDKAKDYFLMEENDSNSVQSRGEMNQELKNRISKLCTEQKNAFKIIEKEYVKPKKDALKKAEKKEEGVREANDALEKITQSFNSYKKYYYDEYLDPEDEKTLKDKFEAFLSKEKASNQKTASAEK